MFDAHCHLDDPRLAVDLDDLLDRARKQGIRGFVSAGVHPERWPIQAQLAQHHPDIFVTYGLHPWVVAEETQSQVALWLEQLACVLQDDTWVTPVGLGEMGLDHSPRVTKDSWHLQEFALREQLALARQWDLPVVLHCVQAHGSLLNILRVDGLPQRGGMIHAFSGSLDTAKAYTQLGLYISVGGMLTRPRATKVQQAVVHLATSRLLCETDAPDMPPHPLEHERNVPENLGFVVQKLAELRGVSVDVMAERITQNARTLFACEV